MRHGQTLLVHQQFVVVSQERPYLLVAEFEPQLELQHLLVPAGQFGQLVVGDDVGALLRLREMIERNDRDLGQFQELSSSTEKMENLAG